MKKYYKTAIKRTIKDFEDTYTHLLEAVKDGRQPTPADLYKLDKYWQMQAQMQKELHKLGDKQIAALGKAFESNFFEVYHSIALQGMDAFNTIDAAMVTQMVNQIWCADGKSWSSRVWGNTEKLAETLNEELINCVLNGNTSSELKKKLMQRFAVSYGNADMIARTELAHIQTQAAQKRYEDYGIKRVQVWADEDERRCELCGKLHEKYFAIGEAMPVPVHPRCRCCIVPVVE
jgi:SPP1 gp7 family putative phage head morphogenesis protein